MSFRYVQRASAGFNGDPSVGEVVSLIASQPVEELRFELRVVAVEVLLDGVMDTRGARVAELRRLLEAGEELAPIIVVDQSTIDGNHRLQAASEAGETHVLAWVLVDPYPQRARG